jgi:hypothetical protein
MSRIQSVERRNGQLASVLWDARGIMFIDYRKGPDHQQRVLHGVIGAFKRRNQEKNGSILRKKMCCFIKTMHFVTNQSKR